MVGEPIECPCCGGVAGDSERLYTDGDPVECGCDGIFCIDAEGGNPSVYDCPCQDHDTLREAWAGTLGRERAAMKRIAVLESELREARAELAAMRDAFAAVDGELMHAKRELREAQIVGPVKMYDGGRVNISRVTEATLKRREAKRRREEKERG